MVWVPLSLISLPLHIYGIFYKPDLTVPYLSLPLLAHLSLTHFYLFALHPSYIYYKVMCICVCPHRNYISWLFYVNDITFYILHLVFLLEISLSIYTDVLHF